MTRDTQESRQVVCSLRMQLANAQMLAARMAPAAPLGGEDNGQKIPDSPDDLRADRTQLIGSIGQLHMVIWHKPGGFLDELSKMRNTFNC